VFENVAFGLRERRILQARDRVTRRGGARRDAHEGNGRAPHRRALGRRAAARRARARPRRAPALLLLDEPLSNLDARLRETMRGEIRRLCKEHG